MDQKTSGGKLRLGRVEGAHKEVGNARESSGARGQRSKLLRMDTERASSRTLGSRMEARGAFTMIAPNSARRDELKRQNKGDDAAIETLRTQRAAVSYTVPKGGIVLGVAPEEEKKGREIQRARGPKVRVEKRPTRTVIQLKLEDIREKCGAAALARFGT
jgi:hypothetical protein